MWVTKPKERSAQQARRPPAALRPRRSGGGHDGPPSRTQATGSIIDDEPRLQGYLFVAAAGGIFSFGDAGTA